MSDFRTDLGKVRGSGAAKGGVHEFIAHRVSAIVLALLLPFFLYGLITALHGGYSGLIAWVSSPFGAFVLLGFITAGMYHGRLGINEVISDYIQNAGTRSLFMLLNTLASFAFWLIGVLAILKIWLGS